MTADHNELIAKLEAENKALLNLLARAPIPCVYCGLPAERMNECARGFPGCGRADDFVLTDEEMAGASIDRGGDAGFDVEAQA